MSSGAIEALTGPNATRTSILKTATFSARLCLSSPCPISKALPPQRSAHLDVRPRRHRRRPGACLAQPGNVLSRAPTTCSAAPDPPQDVRPAAGARCQSAASRAPLARRCPRREQRTAPSLRRNEPRELPLGLVRRRAGRSSAAEMAGPADRDRPGAAVGDVEPQGALRHAPGRPQRLPGIHDRRGAPLRLAGLALLDLERAQPPGLPAAAVELQRHARLAAHLPRPLPGRLRRAAGRRGEPPEGAVRRDGAHRLHQGQRARRAAPVRCCTTSRRSPSCAKRCA